MCVCVCVCVCADHEEEAIISTARTPWGVEVWPAVLVPQRCRPLSAVLDLAGRDQHVMQGNTIRQQVTSQGSTYCTTSQSHMTGPGRQRPARHGWQYNTSANDVTRENLPHDVA